MDIVITQEFRRNYKRLSGKMPTHYTGKDV